MSPYDSESYPPLFRQTSGSSQESNEPVLNVYSLYVIDLECINHEKLKEVCKDWGIFRLVNHGIPMGLLNQLHDHAKNLLNCSFKAKQDLFTNYVSYFWGTPALTQDGVSVQNLDALNFNWVEGFNVPLSQLSRVEVEDPLLNSFRLLLQEYGNHQSRVARIIFQALAKNLNMCEEKSKPYLEPSSGLIRVYRYPCCLVANQAWGMDVHTDSSVLSILSQQSEVGGLQILKDNIWLDIEPIPNSLVINLGDMLQAMSDDEYKSVKHRVKVNKDKERISIGYFAFPSEDYVIKSSRYKPFTYANFRAQVQQDLKTVGYKVGLQNFRLSNSC